jgi:hypothetical protein
MNTDEHGYGIAPVAKVNEKSSVFICVHLWLAIFVPHLRCRDV